MLSSPPDSYVAIIMTLSPQPGETLRDVIAKLSTYDIQRKKIFELLEGDGTPALWVGRKPPFQQPPNNHTD